MEFTGERFIPGLQGNMELEHLHRYFVANKYCIGKRVLDIASGEGYGSFMLSKKAKTVYGIDNSIDAIRLARSKYQRDNLEFRVGDCAQIPLEDCSIDLAVSFETIEHISRHEEFLSEIIRVLDPEGMLILSSPDKYSYTLETGQVNPFHQKELFFFELDKLLKTFFKDVVFLGQKVIFGSALITQEGDRDFLVFNSSAHEIGRSEWLVQPLYWVAFASNNTILMFLIHFMKEI